MEGAKALQIKNGKASVSSLKIYAKPKSEVFFKVAISAITRYFGEFLASENNFSNQNDSGDYSYFFSISFRDCIIGEIFISQINRYFFLIFLYK